MVDSLLRLTYSASDAVAATSGARAVLGAAEVSMRGATLSWRQTSVVDDGITVSRIDANGDAVRLAVSSASELLVVHLRRGSALVRSNDQQVTLEPGGLALVPIGKDARLQFDRADMDVFSFPPAPIARLLAVPKHAVQLHAPRITPRSPELAAYFRQVAHLMTTGVFGVPEVYDRDLVRVHTIDTLTAIVVEAFELTNRSEDDTSRDTVVLRRALAELRDHLADPVSIPEVAQAAGVSIRGLQLIFQRQLGVSPLLHLRDLRLDAAHRMLTSGGAAGMTVADVARLFGYSNSGRFSTHYRNTYGESPAASLQRVRSAARPVPSNAEAEVVQTD